MSYADTLKRNKKGQSRNRQDNLQNYWHRDLPPIDFRGYDFRATLIRREKSGKTRFLSLDRVLTSISWEDKAPLAASVTIQNPRRDKPLPIKEGYEVKIDWAVAGAKRYRPLWRLRIKSVSRTTSSGELSLELVDELMWFAQSKDDFSFKKSKKERPAQGKRKKGWLANQVAREVCRRYGIPTGKLAKGKHRIDNLTEEDTSPLKIIAKAYKLDRDETGRQFVIAMHNGKLEVTTLRRSKDLLVVSENLVEATINEAIKDTFATVLEVMATKKGEGQGKGKEGTKEGGTRKRGKLKIEVRSGDAIMKRFGLIKDVWRVEDSVASESALRQRAKRRLAHFQEPKKEISGLTLPGMPTVKRGDSMLVDLKEQEFRKLVYVTAVTHSVSGGEYTMEVSCTLQDFFEDKEGDKIREKICKKARQKKRTPPRECEPGFDPAAPVQHRERRDKRGAGEGLPRGRR